MQYVIATQGYMQISPMYSTTHTQRDIQYLLDAQIQNKKKDHYTPQSTTHFEVKGTGSLAPEAEEAN
jgi:hypothetical protein